MKRMVEKTRQTLEPIYYQFVLIPRALLNQKRRIKEVLERKKVRIAFVMSSLPMWRAQGLYDLLKQDSRFHLMQVLFPFSTISAEQREVSIIQLQDYCRNWSMPFINLSNVNNPGEQLKKQYDPDIIFYPQPYNHLYNNDLDSYFFSERLICYIPYAMLTANKLWAYRNYLENIAWRLYYDSEKRKQDAKKVLFNKGRNIRVVGELTNDLFAAAVESDPWKIQPYPKKKVIWAPHFSLVNEGYLHRDSFIRLSDIMWDISRQFKDEIQFAFKPHPRLASMLYNLPGWGQSRTDEYYQQWANGENTQLETGNYIDLFKTSDAMVHDCSSFSVEYHYTGKPVLFTADDFLEVTDKLNEFGRDALFSHYQGRTADDVVSFLNNVVLGGKDPMLEQREEFRKKYLLSHPGESVADNIYQDLLVSLGFDK